MKDKFYQAFKELDIVDEIQTRYFTPCGPMPRIQVSVRLGALTESFKDVMSMYPGDLTIEYVDGTQEHFS